MIGAASRRERLHLWLLFLGASFVYGLYATAKHARFMTSVDVGLFDQHLWRAAHGYPLANTIREIGHLWGDHFHPLFLALTPLYWIRDGTVNLLWAQAILVCSAAFPLYRYGRQRLDAGPMLLLTAAFLVSWPIGEGLGFDVHDMALTVPALAWAIWAFEERRATPFWIAVAALLLTREDQGLTVAMFGVLALLRRDWRRGTGLTVVGVGWTFGVIRWVIPSFAGGTYSQWQYAHLAPNAPALILLLLTHPVLLVKSLVLPLSKVALIRRLLEPGLFLGLGSPIALLAIPGVVARLLARDPQYWELSLHWGFPTAIILAFATTDSFGRALPLIRRIHRPRVARWGAATLLLAGLVAAALVPQKSIVLPRFWRDNPMRQAGREAIAMVPPEAPVVATAIALPHLTQRLDAYVDWSFYRNHRQAWTPEAEQTPAQKRESYERGDWIVFDPTEPSPEGVTIVSGLPDFERVFDREGWIVFRRKSPR